MLAYWLYSHTLYGDNSRCILRGLATYGIHIWWLQLTSSTLRTSRYIWLSLLLANSIGRTRIYRQRLGKLWILQSKVYLLVIEDSNSSLTFTDRLHHHLHRHHRQPCLDRAPEVDYWIVCHLCSLCSRNYPWWHSSSLQNSLVFFECY